MLLWSDELEGMRLDARRAVDVGLPPILELMGRGDGAEDPSKLSRDEQLAKARAAMEMAYLPSPEAELREIAGVPCRVFTPANPARGIYLHFHGGGMILGDAEMGDPGNVDLRDRFDLAVVSVNYRLAPEHPYPAGPQDGVAVARWLIEHGDELVAARAPELGDGPLPIITGGESAGGYMAALVPLWLRDQPGQETMRRHIAGMNLVFGVYDWGRSPSQRGLRANDGLDLLDPEGITFFTECYLPEMSDEERRDPAISPAFADLRGLPPALMSVGTADHLLDDTLVLAARSTAAGNDVELLVLPEMPHGFMAIACGMTDVWTKRTYQWFARILDGWSSKGE